MTFGDCGESKCKKVDIKVVNLFIQYISSNGYCEPVLVPKLVQIFAPY